MLSISTNEPGQPWVMISGRGRPLAALSSPLHRLHIIQVLWLITTPLIRLLAVDGQVTFLVGDPHLLVDRLDPLNHLAQLRLGHQQRCHAIVGAAGPCQCPQHPWERGRVRAQAQRISHHHDNVVLQ